jgi:hypothetical protein
MNEKKHRNAMYRAAQIAGLCFICAWGYVGCHSAPQTDLSAKSDILPQSNTQVTNCANLLQNPGFESGLDGWKWLDWSKGWSAFKLSSDYAHEGAHSLHLPVFSADKRPTVVWGGVQELELPDEIPECIEGYYYVDNWQSGDWKQYLQMVVIDLSHDLGPGQGQAQLRYIVSGSKEPPLSISNASYLFAEKERRDTPVLNQWTHFSVNPREDYQKSWQYTPTKGSKLRVLFEARFDLHHTAQPARADVYYDDLYFGPKTATHCVQ